MIWLSLFLALSSPTVVSGFPSITINITVAVVTISFLLVITEWSWMLLPRLSRTSSAASLVLSSLVWTPSPSARAFSAISTISSTLRRPQLSAVTAIMMLSTASANHLQTPSNHLPSTFQLHQSFTATDNIVDVRIPNANRYVDIPTSLQLEQLVVVHRHGDRAQIARSLGQTFKEDPTITNLWRKALPTSSSLALMRGAAKHLKQPPVTTTPPTPAEQTAAATWSQDLYSGWDKDNIPYAQLTDIGAKQLMQVGQHLRQRYGAHKVLPKTLAAASTQLYCRSTNICRTIQSIRSLLAGMHAEELLSQVVENAFETNHDGDVVDQQAIPEIETRPRQLENMFPQVDGECFAMAHRRSIIFPPSLIHEQIKGYERIEKKMRLVLGFPSVEAGHSSKVNWLNVKEILTCHMVHGIDQVKLLDAEDESKATEIAAWTWGVLYKDDVLNRLAIGRFVHDLLADIQHKQPDKTCLIYSGHDSTLVPLLAALGVYDDTWPDYASNLIFEIATTATNSNPGEELPVRYIRVIFNDEVMQIGRFPHTGALYEDEDIPRVSPQYPGWYPLDDVVQFLSRLALTNEQYQVEKTQVSTDNLEADQEAMAQNRNDLSATVNGNASSGKKSSS